MLAMSAPFRGLASTHSACRIPRWASGMRTRFLDSFRVEQWLPPGIGACGTSVARTWVLNIATKALTCNSALSLALSAALLKEGEIGKASRQTLCSVVLLSERPLRVSKTLESLLVSRYLYTEQIPAYILTCRHETFHRERAGAFQTSSGSDWLWLQHH